jgi:hypothetical protein
MRIILGSDDDDDDDYICLQQKEKKKKEKRKDLLFPLFPIHRVSQTKKGIKDDVFLAYAAYPFLLSKLRFSINGMETKKNRQKMITGPTRAAFSQGELQSSMLAAANTKRDTQKRISPK